MILMIILLTFFFLIELRSAEIEAEEQRKEIELENPGLFRIIFGIFFSLSVSYFLFYVLID